MEHEEEIEVVYPPWYSPALKPEEYLNCDPKARAHSGKPLRSKAQLKKTVISHMRMLQKMPHRVAKQFEHEDIRYAA